MKIIIVIIIVVVGFFAPYIFYHIYSEFLPRPSDYLIKDWHCEPGTEISADVEEMSLWYDTTYGRRQGDFNPLKDNFYGQFIWNYDENTKYFELKSFSGIGIEWSILLMAEFNLSAEPITLTTYYISDSNFTNFAYFNASLFDGVTWTGLYD